MSKRPPQISETWLKLVPLFGLIGFSVAFVYFISLSQLEDAVLSGIGLLISGSVLLIYNYLQEIIRQLWIANRQSGYDGRFEE
ncbi:hypothetical protein P1J78_13905 [Psychromarinibacter sp. C21-152]|uniref:Uncharacterized protein n=1 Tax=Psychromarinibacter sediminicola TaxID=3033385 RepID=A0AAE3NSW9_9RHOB|nr:hypothetical protein [Psychromarinibacter sediminicola]MDF0601836.1 hypothetical protein [Psychromarinibacter sediminicola]